MACNKKENDPVKEMGPLNDTPMLYKGLFDYLVFEADVERVKTYHDQIKDFFANNIVREAIMIANHRVTTAK